ncbi:cholesterol oxidase like protein [Ophiocordyceps camponoti-floridani]|uniref:Cholesterol oxidase like protein n=1 Tax=Ophiocordyceps camponoti-floridani TaxID=2030778 RepID=A0A8H4Q7Z7_9HYPO|nr:cholesterol oxidase like protein [Ophiocordyceps camponoti-floridani]
MRLTLELRILGGSDVILAPQYGNLATASIEVLTVPDTVVWMGYGSPAEINNSREYIRDVACKKQFEEFPSVVDGIGSQQGWT